jgi:hypothetical protein
MQKFLVLFFKKNKLITANYITTKQASTRLHKHIKLSSTNNRQVTWQLAPTQLTLHCLLQIHQLPKSGP